MMNERIQQLLDESKLASVQEMFEPELYKFAELIVRECCSIVRDEVQYIGDFDKADLVVNEVKKRFGVE